MFWERLGRIELVDCEWAVDEAWWPSAPTSSRERAAAGADIWPGEMPCSQDDLVQMRRYRTMLDALDVLERM
jgi:hypothetical protein